MRLHSHCQPRSFGFVQNKMQHYRSRFTRVALAGAMMLGVTSLAAAQQHRTWYLAEGATNAFFQEEILIANPTSTDANVTVAFLLSTGTEVPVTFVVPNTSRHTLRVNELAGLENVNASAVVTSDVDILVERSMDWPGPARRGGHNSARAPPPAPKCTRGRRARVLRDLRADRQPRQHRGPGQGLALCRAAAA